MAFVLTSGAMVPWSGGAFRYRTDAPSLTPPPRGQISPVIDPAGLFDEPAHAAIAARVEAVRSRYGLELSVITTRGLNGESFDDFASRYHNGWTPLGLRNAAVIVLFAPSEGLVGISNFDTLNAVFTAADRQAIIDAMRPLARAGAYRDAAMVALDRIDSEMAAGPA